MRKTIAIDLGGTKALGAVFSPQGEILTSKNVYLRGASGEAAGDLVLGLIDELESACPEGKVVAVGICVPGIAYQDSGCVWAPNIPGWDHYPLRERIRNKMGEGVHVRIESDRTCYILGETWKGAAKGSRNAIYMAVGTGIGAGIITEGRVLRGSGDIAGAIGWMGLEYPFREDYVQTGCFESYASGNGIGQRLWKAVLAAPEYSGVLSRKPVSELTSYDAFENYDSDPLARAVLDKAVVMWGMAAANLASLLDPEIIVFGGGVFGPAARFLDRIREEACKWGQPIVMKKLRFAVSELPGEAALFGAARLVAEESV